MNDDAGNFRVLVGGENFFFNLLIILGAKIFDFYADICAILNFEVDIFSDDRIVAVADNQKLRLGFKTCDLVPLAFLDKTGEFATI